MKFIYNKMDKGNNNKKIPYETKICDGIYATNISKNTENKNQNQNFFNIEGEKFIYHNTEELISILEVEFNEYGDVVQKLFESNEEMLKFDPKDYDLIQARQENLEIIQHKLKQMKEIQNKVKSICPHHPIVNINVFSLFNKNINEDDNKEKEQEISQENNYQEDKNNDIITEIEL